MKILVTGASGFVGRRLSRELIAEGHEVIGVRRPGGNCRSIPDVVWLDLDLTTPDVSRADVEVDAIVHLAQSRRYREFPAGALDVFGVNIASTMCLLELARRVGARFVHASTANVYAPDTRPLTETAILSPTSFYGASKRSAEVLVESYSSQIVATVIRLFTVYGPGQEGMLVPDLIGRVKRGDPIHLDGPSGLALTPTFIDDVTATIRRIIGDASRSSRYEVFNCGGSQALTIREMAEQIGIVVRRAPQFEFTGRPQPAGWCADCSKLKTMLGLSPRVLFDEGIERTIGAEQAA
jgi:nucleoside-diphosphate-sugar epimerase